MDFGVPDVLGGGQGGVLEREGFTGCCLFSNFNSILGLSPSTVSRSKSREAKVRELPGAELAIEDSNQDGKDNQERVELGLEEVTVDTSHLSEFECTAVKKKGKRSKNNKAQGIQKDLEEVDF